MSTKDRDGEDYARDLEIAKSMQAEVRSLPMDDPLRAALGLPSTQGDHLRDELCDVDVPDLDQRLMAIPEIAQGRASASPATSPWARVLALAAALTLAATAWWLGRAFPFEGPPADGDGEAVAQSAAGIAAPTEPDRDDAPNLIAVKIWHETCPACKIIDPRFETVTSAFNTKEVLFVTLDMSTEASRHQSALMAEVLGIGDVYREYFGSSGFVLLVDPTSQSVVGKLTTDHDVDRMRQLLADAAGLSSAAGSPAR